MHQDEGVSGLHARLPPFGAGFVPRLAQSSIPVLWRPCALTALQSELAHAYLASRPGGGKCHFGCTSRAKLKVQSLVSCWRGAKLGSGICSKSHNRLITELNDKNTPLITEADQELFQRTRLQGPCYFGCKTSALDNSFKGRMQWHRAPFPCHWPGVEAGVVLCNGCYNGYRYHAARPGRTRSHD